jgi:hypothetical protein
MQDDSAGTERTTWTPIVISACRSRGIWAPRSAELQFLEEDEGRGGERDPQLIGPEAGAAGASEGEGVFQFL